MSLSNMWKSKSSLLFLCLLAPALLHAKSDLQLDVGLRIAEVSWNDKRLSAIRIEGQSGEVNETQYGMCVGLTNYNVWGIGRSGVISAGFMDGICASFSEHNARGATFAIGPAFAAEMGRVLAFQAAAAFSLGIIKTQPQSGYSESSLTLGFALDARVCFMPEARAGPMAGARYEYSKIKDIFDMEIDRGAFCFYAGISMNLSKW